MDNQGLALRKLATILGVSQPCLAKVRRGKRPLPDALKRKVEALGAYHLLIGDKHVDGHTGDAGAEKPLIVGIDAMVGVGRIELPTSCSQSRHPTAGLHPDAFLILSCDCTLGDDRPI